MPYNEAETRFYLIDPKLRAKGYDDPTRLRLETPAPVDIEGPKGRRRKGPGRTDYLICIAIGAMPAPLPVGLIEAKPETADPLSGMEQGKGYGDCRRFSIHYIFPTNGHRYGEFDTISGLTTGPHDFDLFPTHAELVERYARDTGIDLSEPAANLLFTSDSPAYAENPRYYQSAAIRAVITKILHCERDGLPARALLVLATGSGKTIVAANLLHRLNQAGRLAKPALFLCDRDELRQQALGKLRNVFKDGARIVTSDRGENSARNARIQIATYQTLGLDDDAKDVASFLTRHYPEPNSFSVIIIDECHRSAWNRWRVVLERNPDAIQIGLTATPRELREPKRQRREDQDITANNLAYFGPPVYEYDLIQAQEDGYLAACEIVRRAVSLDGETFTDAEVVLKKGVDIRTGKRVKRDALKPKYDATRFDNDLVIPERIAAMCKDLFNQLCANGGPEQKVIVFCTRDLHADRVAMQLNNRYAEWCKTHEQTPKDRYAFKCTEQGGSELIETFRGSGQRCFIACTVDLLATGVDIERLNAVCFFRYLDSAILFYQMVGRGTRIHEDTAKYKFWLYDYTGVTRLFGTDFITADPTRRSKGTGNGDGEGNGGKNDPALVVEMALGEKEAKRLHIADDGRLVPILRNGRQTLITLDEYRAELAERLRRETGDLDGFRSIWVEQRDRAGLIQHLRDGQADPERLRELEQCHDLDLFDLLAHHGFAASPLTRRERADGYLIESAPWLDSLDPDAAQVLRGFGQQFAIGGTEALESPSLWDVPEIQRAGGFYVLSRLDRPPAEVMREAKGRLFK